MKRHLVIATAAAAALIAGGTVTAAAVSGGAGSAHTASGTQVSAQQAAPQAGSGTAQVQDGRSSIPMQDDDADGQEDSARPTPPR